MAMQLPEYENTGEGSHSIDGIKPTRTDTFDRYRELRNESRERLGIKELTNDRFITMLLDVWEYYLEERQ